jgi:hypothetical protein
MDVKSLTVVALLFAVVDPRLVVRASKRPPEVDG